MQLFFIMILLATSFLQVFSCDLTGEFRCTSTCSDRNGNIEIFGGETTTIAKVVDITSLYTINIQQGLIFETEHCVAKGTSLTCATTNLTNEWIFVKEDIRYPLIQKLLFDENCSSFVKLERKFVNKTICQTVCVRKGEINASQDIVVRTSEDFTCSGYCLHSDQTITYNSPERNIVKAIAGTNNQLSEFENRKDGFQEFGYCGLLPNNESLCFTKNISIMDKPEVLSRSVFVTGETYNKYVRSLTENEMFVCANQCSSAVVTPIFQNPKCSITGSFGCSGACIHVDGSTVRPKVTVDVEEVKAGVFYNATSSFGEVQMCVLDQTGDSPSLICEMIEKSDGKGRIAALAEITYDSRCNSFTEVLRDLIARSVVAVCEFNCNRTYEA